MLPFLDNRVELFLGFCSGGRFVIYVTLELIEPVRVSRQLLLQMSRNFTLGGKPWYMLGVNYRPTSQGGRATLDMFRRDLYDPEIWAAAAV